MTMGQPLCIQKIRRFTGVTLLLTVIILSECLGFNIDLRHPLIYSSDPNSNFGYSVGLLKSSGGSSVLMVGAPTGNSSNDNTIQPGVIYVCGLSSTTCRELPLQLKKEKIIQGRYYYDEYRDNGWLGVSIDISPDDSQFVACGHLWKDKQFSSEIYLANGICYVGASNLTINSVRRLLPLVRKGKQLEERQYIYALGLSGMSAHYSRDGTTLLLGAPGAYRFAGTIAAVNDYPNLLSSNAALNPDYRVFIPNLERDDDSYFGTSVTSGKFLNNQKVYYVAGAPRQGPNAGKVYIFSFPEKEDWEGAVIFHSIREGVQMGEYFGASVSTSDFNNDGFDDLVVGSPLYSTEVEEGRVYVYMSDGMRVSDKPYHLTGSSVMGGRFGTTTAAIGDLNLDGFNDLAVGAPYEGNGVIYIYHGSISGLKNKFAQRIAAADVHPKLQGFGMSISKSRDVDGNFYPDLAVGASTSSQAVVLRSKPIAQISGSISFSVNHINTDVKNCSGATGEPVTCFQAQICSIYRGKHVPNTFDVLTVVNIDPLLSRIEIYERGQLFSKFNFTSTFSTARSNCRTLILHAKNDNIQDFLTPVQMTVFYIPVQSDHERLQFCPTCPAIDTISTGNISKSLTFFTGCGEDDKCFSELHLDAQFFKYGPDDALVLGTDDTLQLFLTVTNKGEPAFQTLLKLVIPPDVDFARTPGECSISTISNLTCALGNPLGAGQSVTLTIVIDLKRLTKVENLVFNIDVTTASFEVAEAKDSFKSLSLPVKSITGVSIDGWYVFEELFVYNRSSPGFAPLTHLYQITKTEPSPFDTLDIEFKFPISTSSRESFVQQFSIVVLNNYKPVAADRCTTSVSTPKALTAINHESTEHGRAAVMDCDSMACHVLKCTLGPFIGRDTVTVNISAVLDLSSIVSKILVNEDIVIARSFGSTNVDGKISDLSVRTVFIPQDLVPSAGGIAWWIILVSVIGGILLLALIIFALYKFGFFQRTRPENLMDESDDDHGDNPDEEEAS